jgi:hypothetical protein
MWNGGDNLLEPSTLIDVVFQLEEGTYYGYSTIRWCLEDFEERLDSI